jgi:hypothetical protein
MFMSSSVSTHGAASADQPIGEEEEVTLICDLGDDASGPVDELRVMVVRFPPRVRDFYICRERRARLKVEYKVEFAENMFLIVVVVRRSRL